MAMCNCMDRVDPHLGPSTRGRKSVGAAVMLALTAAAAVSPRLIGGWRQAEVAAVRPSIVNCTWQNFTQKIDHFGDASGTFPQRLCLYDKWWRPGGGAGGQFRAAADAPGPILFYTGNESPVDEYVNNTGLMWEIGERLGALLLLAPTLTPTLTSPPPPTNQARCSCLLSIVTSRSPTRRCAGRTASAASPTARPPRPSPTGSPSSRRCERGTARAPPSWRLVAHVRGHHPEPRVLPPPHTQQDSQAPLCIMPHPMPCPAIYHHAMPRHLSRHTPLSIAPDGGMLAGWFRMKYPAVVDGAIAASAPIWQAVLLTC